MLSSQHQSDRHSCSDQQSRQKFVVSHSVSPLDTRSQTTFGFSKEIGEATAHLKRKVFAFLPSALAFLQPYAAILRSLISQLTRRHARQENQRLGWKTRHGGSVTRSSRSWRHGISNTRSRINNLEAKHWQSCLKLALPVSVQLQFDLRKTENEDQKQNARWIVFSAIDQGRLKMDEALLEARRLEHAYTLGHVLFGAGWVEWIAGSPHQAKRYAEETVALSSEHGFPIWLAVGWVVQGWSLAALGQEPEGLALLTKGLSIYRGTAAILSTPSTLMMLAEAHAKAGHTRR
jgi:hypothetical protein